MITIRRLALLSLAVCWTAALSQAQAQESEKAFYAGKTVRMIVGSGVGGGYDVFSRLIAPYLGKTLGATVIVENQPGAGGLVALNKLYTAPPDGLQISLVQGTMAAVAQLTGEQAELGTGYDLAYQVAVRSRPADLFRGGDDRCRTCLGDGLPRQPRRARPPADGAAPNPAGPARHPASVRERDVAQPAAHRRR